MPRPCLPLLAALAATALAGCAGHAPEPAPPPAPIATPAPMPQPPAGLDASTELLASPNRGLSPAASLWHLRAGLNVAALQCSSASGIVEDYGRLLRVHRAPLANAHDALRREAGGGDEQQARFDRSMTAVYNYFAQPVAGAEFCVAAARVASTAPTLSAEALEAFAPDALAELDAPFVRLQDAQAEYRRALAAWHAGEPSAEPRLAYDPNLFLASETVTSSARRAAR